MPGHAGYRLYAEGRFDEACERYRESLSIWPYQSEIYASLAIALVRSAKPEEACEAADRALELRPGAVEMLTLSGRCLTILGRYKEAIQSLKEAIIRNPSNAEMNYFILGKAYRRTGAFESALTVFRGLYENRFHRRNAGPYGFQALTEMAHCLLALHREPGNLIALCREARPMTPDDARSLENLRMLLEKAEAEFDLTPGMRHEVDRLKRLLGQDLKKIEES
jgi:tetratricopeptide (TPR) repeat protein